MPLTTEMKKEIIDYYFPQGSFSKGLIECDTPLAQAYANEEVTGKDIYAFMDECNDLLTDAIGYFGDEEEDCDGFESCDGD